MKNMMNHLIKAAEANHPILSKLSDRVDAFDSHLWNEMVLVNRNLGPIRWNRDYLIAYYKMKRVGCKFPMDRRERGELLAAMYDIENARVEAVRARYARVGAFNEGPDFEAYIIADNEGVED